MELGPDHFLAEFDNVLTATASRWQAVPADRIDWRRWDDGSGDDDFVVFNGLTANTHLLTGDAGAVLMALIDAGSSRTPGELLARVSGDDAGADDLAALGAILAGLEHIGLASRVAS